VPLGLLDEREHVAHAEDARRHALGVEDVEVGELLAGGGEHDRLAGHVPHRQCGATARVAVELGQDDAGESDTFLERGGGRDGVLTDHRVDDEQRLVGLHGVPDAGGLGHQLRVDTEAARGVDHDDVVHRAAGVVDGVAGHLDGVADAAARLGREDVDTGLAGHDLQLLHRVGSLQVGGHEQGGVALGLQPAAELAGERRLTGTLQTGQHDDRRGLLGQPDAAGLAAEDVDELLVDDLDDLLCGVQRPGDVGAAGALLDGVDELPDHRERDVGLEQGDADLARGGVDVGIG
jgi:hypothetical protein